MTPAARIAAAADILDRILAGDPAEAALLRWSRGSRFAGSGDRAAIRDLVFHALRCRNSLAHRGGVMSGRGLMIGLLRDEGRDPCALFTGEGHAPAPLTAEEMTDHPGDAIDLPDWILPRWRASLGPRADDEAAALRLRAPVWLRVNPLRATLPEALAALAEDEIAAESHLQLPSALRVTRNERRLSTSRAYRDGVVELQDLSVQLACATVPVRAGQRILDYCAGGGGKALALAGRAENLRIAAHDADRARMRDLPVRAARSGAKVQIVPRPSGVFDLVVADVPCSGSGTWRRSPDARWRLSEPDLQALVAAQARILDDASGHVATGGLLAYMTCSMLDDENTRQIAAFLARRPDFALRSAHRWSPLSASDGFFLALLERSR
ncbi:MAG: RsmB/NOP family class I SAM-dependent RNA methyltransferase [Paracoccus sp. (in: a-proteobacteria)]|uniref:RsmB/NOP family class I SAM-dependent RNA methyltransferase n=1 Tax=unclassified Paracoccus (in: a-proteobacteria) TaxID=2688777 RepID=UPI000C5C89B2|nr:MULTISPECIES: RsmB/NOP family class I SAM-dependent RNA methyltransferase [unclassified Paracoccus (in: a-proteobacteria)]MAN55351.1 SAM-dependent methyltransferase [Paracoccus sp. (in: a-proteobacteria)]MBA48400.1 SAM-dependent methyltransferase [Paracoccus sp. (in: a-proteobacteria)]HIC64396.1 RsmB/NOP family class I SAM-dependent RNA methyltransferase [Paracoccus sp. (in: a-proteobacteria)]|tara:strand:+ start:2081 stop:3226 length:1146 start_codon:yes stop_codon:yes gene_type:complete